MEENVVEARDRSMAVKHTPRFYLQWRNELVELGSSVYICIKEEKNGRPPNGLLFDARGCWSSFALFNFVAPFILNLKRKRKEGGEAKKKKKKKNRRIPIKLERASI